MQVIFRFYAELNDFLPREKRYRPIPFPLKGQQSVKDAIEAMGPPHTEVDLILVNGVSVGFEYRLKENDQVSVYPMFESLDISPIQILRPSPLREVQFVLDTHLGRLAKYLRMLGFDALYGIDYEDETLAFISQHEGRIILTKDRGILKRRAVTHGYLIRHIQPKDQIVEVIHRFDLRDQVKPLSRCIRCNGLIQTVSMENIQSQVPPRTQRYYDEFSQCPSCRQVYWKGPHYLRMQEFIQHIMETTKKA